MFGHEELVRFLWVVGVTIAIAVPLTLHKIRMPLRLQIETLDDGQLTPKQLEFFARHDLQLRDLGYTPFKTYQITNIPNSKNLLRTYLSSTDPVRCTVQVTAGSKGPVQFDHVEFITDYADGVEAMTTNRTLSQTFDPEPYKFVQECRGISNLAEVKQRHDRFADQFQIRGPVFTDKTHFLELLQRQYDKQMSHQVRQRVLRLDPMKGQYRVTLKWALRVQRNMFNPLADNFTATKLAIAIAIGGFPVMLRVGQAQITSWLNSSALQGTLRWGIVLTAAYLLAGIASGLLFGHKSFVWAFLLAFVPTLFMPPSAGHTVGLSLLMGWSADLTFRIRGRQKRVV